MLTIRQNPFGVAAQSNGQCWSKVNGSPPPFNVGSKYPVVVADWVMPVLIAAIDPVAEARLDRLNGAVVSGKYLTEDAGDTNASGGVSSFPVLASSSIGMNETAKTQIQLLATRPALRQWTSGG